MSKQAGLLESGMEIGVGSQASRSGENIFTPRTILAGLLVFAGYYLGARIGLMLSFPSTTVSVMWPPNSILLAALLLTPSRIWWFLILSALPAHLITELSGGIPLRMVLCWFVTNSSEALIGAVSTILLAGPTLRVDRMRGIGALLLSVGLIAPFLSSFLDSAIVALNNFGQQPFWKVWRTRVASNAFTALAFVPVIVAWGNTKLASFRQVPARRLAEAGLLLVGVVSVTLLVYCWGKSGPATVPILLCAPLPFLLLAAVRFGPKETSTALLCVALLAIWGAVHGRGPFTSSTPEQNALSIQVFFIVVSITLLILATTIAERSRAEERFTKAFHSSPDAMVISHLKDACIIEVNERFENMFGLKRNQTVGHNVFDLDIFTSKLDRDKLSTGITAGNSIHDLEVCLRTRNGELRYTLISADTDEIGDDVCLILIIRDITDRKRAEEAQQNLAHVSRLAVVGELTAMVAHEINQPLGAILSNAEAAEMLLDSENPPLDEIRQILADIRDNDLRADEAIRRIRALLRKREMQMQPLDLNETVSDVLRLVSGDSLRRGISIQKELLPRLPLVIGDRVHLQQVLLNLIVNGMDAMNDTTGSTRQLTVTTKLNGGSAIEVAVADSGKGIAQDKMTRIFESFFSTKKDGMGLGLSIARSIIEAHQGRLWAENNSAGGATLRFTVPVSTPSQPTHVRHQ